LFSCILTCLFFGRGKIFFFITVHVGDVRVCWVIQIGVFKSIFDEKNHISNAKDGILKLFESLLVDFLSFSVERRVEDFGHKFYLRLPGRIVQKSKVYSVPVSLVGSGIGKVHIPVEQVVTTDQFNLDSIYGVFA